MTEHQEEKRSNLHLDNNGLMWLVGGGTIALALFQLLGQQVAWLLLISGIIILITAVHQANPQRWETLNQWMSQLEPSRAWAMLGGILILTGLVVRFAPRDIGLALSIAGLLLLAGGIWYLVRNHSSKVVSLPLLPVVTTVMTTDVGEETKPESEGYARLSEGFRLRVSETVFRNAQTTSLMNFIIGLTFFLVGIGLFILLAYGVFQLQSAASPSGNEDQLSQMLSARLLDLQGQSFDQVLLSLSPLLLLILRDISARQLVPIVSLIIIALIGSRLIVNATRLSQRRVIRDTLAELGPLQDTLAGIPPRKPFMQVAEQSLRHTRRAFTFRLWMSIVLGIIGMALLIVTAIRGLRPGADNWITTATVGASGVISFVVSLVTTRQREIGENLLQVIKEENQVAQAAQRSEIVDLYVAQLLRGAKPQQLKGVLDILDRLHTPMQGKTELDKTNVGEAETSK